MLIDHLLFDLSENLEDFLEKVDRSIDYKIDVRLVGEVVKNRPAIFYQKHPEKYIIELFLWTKKFRGPAMLISRDNIMLPRKPNEYLNMAIDNLELSYWNKALDYAERIGNYGYEVTLNKQQPERCRQKINFLEARLIRDKEDLAQSISL